MKQQEQLATYQRTYDKLLATQYRGVSGVKRVDSGKPGPTAAILACTHGNEPAGLGAIDYLLSSFDLKRGAVLFIVVNTEAALKSLTATDEIAKEAARYVDFNMNRIPQNLTDWKGSREGARLQELLPILKEVDGGVLDIHSTSADAPPMLITVDDAGTEAAQCHRVQFAHIISNITPFLSGRFLIELFNESSLRWLAECGQHQCLDAASRAVNISLSFLEKLEMIDPQPTLAEEAIEKTSYRVKSAFCLPQECGEFRLLNMIEPFEAVTQGQKIAYNREIQVESPQAGYAIMCPKTENPLDSSEALFFLCDKTESCLLGKKQQISLI